VELADAQRGAGAARAVRKWASGPREAYQPYAANEDGIPAMSRPGAGYRVHTTGLNHAENGFPTQNPEVVERNLTRLLGKFDRHRDAIDSWQTVGCEDADVVIVTLGITARAAMRAIETCRARGARVGLFRPITLWPFPEEALREATGKARAVLVPEMNNGQLSLEVQRILGDKRVDAIHRFNGEPITPVEIAERAESLAKAAPAREAR
jgi:2-oxoglutarate/2-oxoacid ferredoxin oxidoreductase subunit alpha